jgi:hypothetical protein
MGIWKFWVGSSDLGPIILQIMGLYNCLLARIRARFAEILVIFLKKAPLGKMEKQFLLWSNENRWRIHKNLYVFYAFEFQYKFKSAS